jgi:hypothetical protein
VCASVIHARAELLVCECEGVAAREILDRQAERRKARLESPRRRSQRIGLPVTLVERVSRDAKK